MTDKLRLWFQWFCGVLGHEKAAQARHAELMRQFTLMEGRYNDLLAAMGRVEQQLQIQHIPRRQPNPAEYDWEQVQAMELAEMLANPPKENN